MVQSPEVCASVPSSNSFCLKFNTCPYHGEAVSEPMALRIYDLMWQWFGLLEVGD